MELGAKIGFYLNPVGNVKELIKKWKPKDCHKEKHFENSLYEYLEKKLPDIEVVRQFGIGRLKVDIAVGKRVFIELKFNLTSTSQFQRLIGQLSLFRREKEEDLIVLICGKTDSNILKQLKKEIERYNRDVFLYDTMHLMKKSR